MGSRRGGDFGKFAGANKSGRVRSAIQDVNTALEHNKPAKIVVGTAIDVLALSNPAIGTLVLTYKVSKALYKIASKANDEYARSHDMDAALNAAAGEAVHVGIGAARDQAVGSFVDVGWTAIKATAGIPSSEMQDKIIESAAKNTLSEVLPK